jgi:hypothetical protein
LFNPDYSCHSERSEESPFARREILRCAQDDKDILSLGGAVVMPGATMIYTIARRANE